MGANASRGATRVTSKQEFRTIGNLHPGYVKKLKERFELAKDPFTLDREELKELFRSTEKELDVIFEHFDPEGDGAVDSCEFVTALAFLSHSTLEEKASLIFDLYDFDLSKYISKDELTVLLTNSLQALRSLGGNGTAAPRVEEIEKKAQELFRVACAGGNERITQEEFSAWIKRDSDVVQTLLGYGIAKREDLGEDLGNGMELFYDQDLENELIIPDSYQDEKRANAKIGIDFEIEEDDKGNFIEKQTAFQSLKTLNDSADEAAVELAPLSYQPSLLSRERPEAGLQLEYVYGYRCHDSRNNLAYTCEGKVIYHAAGVGIVLSQRNNTQQFMYEHDDDILCLAVDPSGQYCATGQVGPHPWLCIWDTCSLDCLARFRAPLVKGIKCVAFSKDGEQVVASGLDSDHTIAIFQWRKQANGEPGALLATTKGPTEAIWSLGFNGSGSEVVATCTRSVVFYGFQRGVLRSQPGTGWTTPPAVVPCHAYVDDTLFTGQHDGTIAQWSGRKVQVLEQGHDSVIYSMKARTVKRGVVTGGKDGRIKVWELQNGPDFKLRLERTLDLRTLQGVNALMPSVKSASEHPKSGHLLVGTRGGELIELGAVASEAPRMLLKSHFDGEVHGLATHPRAAEFLTVGRDNLLAVWNAEKRRQTRYAKLECAADAVAYSHDGSQIAVGMRNGYLLVLDAKYAPVAKVQTNKNGARITVVKFSEKSKYCAVGTSDGGIRLYDVNSKFRKLVGKVIKAARSPIAHLDFSMNHRYIVANTEAQEVFFFEVDTGNRVPSQARRKEDVKALRECTWQTWTCTAGWPVQGISRPNPDGTGVNACARSPDGKVLATGDDFGRVSLYRYPCPLPNASGSHSLGHAALVTNVAFTANASHLITTGGADLSVFQWAYGFDEAAEHEAYSLSKLPQQKLAEEQEEEKREQLEEEKQAEAEGDDEQEDEPLPFRREEAPEEGDQALAVQPFLAAVQATTPSGFDPKTSNSREPESSLTLVQAHGVRCRDTRGCVKYTSEGKVVYITAGLGVVQDRDTLGQEFFNLHQDDVVSMALHPNGDIVATGQMAARGRAKLVDVFVWRASTQEVLAQLTGFHRRAVTCLSFSPSGTRLLTVGEDDAHSVAVYDWATQALLCSARTGGSKVHGAAWKNNSEFVTVDARAVQFFQVKGKNLQGKKGVVGGARGRLGQHLSCLFAFDSELCLTGNESGDILLWKSPRSPEVLKAHDQGVQQLIALNDDKQVVSAGSDGRILIWDQQMQQQRAINLKSIHQHPVTAIRSIDFSEGHGGTFLVGTAGAEILEVQINSAQRQEKVTSLVAGHFAATAKSELWGAACHPQQQLVATCGADRTIRIWDITQKRQVKASAQFSSDLTSLDWSPCGRFFAVGDAAGHVLSVDAQTLRQVSKQKFSFKVPGKEPWVQDVKISPKTGDKVAFGVHGGNSGVEVLQVNPETLVFSRLFSVPSVMRSALLHLDWSQDGELLALNSQSYELLFFNVKTKKLVTAAEVKDADWHTWTCKFGFPVQGIWSGADYTEVNSVCRSHGQKVLATADDSGKVKLFRYPCTKPKAGFKEHRGHSAHVTRAVFSASDKYLVTTGGADKTVLVWQTDLAADDADDDDDQVDEKEGARISEDLTDQSKIAKQRAKDARRDAFEAEKERKKAEGESLELDPLDLFLKYEDAEGDEFLAVKPWRGQIKAPAGCSKAPKNQHKAPLVKATIDWVHGYRGHKAKNNVKSLVDDTVAYHTAGLVVLYNPRTNTQSHFDRHSDDVTCLALSADRRTLATGEVGRRPKIFVWDGPSLQVKHTLQGKLQRGIKALAFSPSGSSLAAVDSSDDHQLAVYAVESGVCLALVNGGKAQIVDLCFRDDGSLATAGVRHLRFWTLSKGLSSKNALWGKAATDKNVACVAFHDQLALTGSAKGRLLIWKDNTVCDTKHLHEGVLDTILVTREFIYTGGRDFVLNVLEASKYGKVYSIRMDDKAFDSVRGQPRALDATAGGGLVVGTFGGEIFHFQVNPDRKKIGEPTALVRGHYAPKAKDTNEVWGMCTIPGTDEYITVGDDATLRVWSASKRKQVRVVDLNRHQDGKQLPADPKTKELALAAQARAVDVSPDGSLCAVGFRSGQIRVYDTKTWAMKVAKKTPMAEWIEDLKFSPDQMFLAVTCHDNHTYVFSFPKVELFATLTGSTSFVTHLDWAADSRFIRTNDGSGELLHYLINQTGRLAPVASSTCKNQEWRTHTCPLSWATQGVWQPSSDNSDINHCDRSNFTHPDGYQLVATADDFSQVKLFRYPAMVDRAEAVVCRGHSSHVTKVKFGEGDYSDFLFSAGGNDATVIQWRIQV